MISQPNPHYLMSSSRSSECNVRLQWITEDAEFEIANEDILIHEETKAEYTNPERMKPGWTGGDAERVKWFFKTVAPGSTSLTIRILFRFQIESECIMHITVE